MSKQGKALTPQFKIPLRLINIGLLLQTVLALAGIFLFFWMPSHYGFNFKSLADYPDLIGTIGEFILYGIFGSVVSEKLKRHQNCSKLTIAFGVILLVVTVIATFGIAYWWYAYFAGVSAKAMTPAQISLVGNTDMLQLQHTCYNYILQILGYASAILMLSAGAYLAGTNKTHWKLPSTSNPPAISSAEDRESLASEEPHTHYRRLQHNVEDSAIKYHSHSVPNKQKNVGANDVLTEFKHQETSHPSHSHSTLSPEVDAQTEESPTKAEHEEDIAQEIRELKDQSYQDKLNQYIDSAKHVEEEPLAEEKRETPHTKSPDSYPDLSATQNPSGTKQTEPEQKKPTNSQSTKKNQNQSHENFSHSENSSSKQNHRNNKNYRNRNKKKSYSNSSRSQNNQNAQKKQNRLKQDSPGSQNRQARGQNGKDGMTNASSKPKQPQCPRHPQVVSQREQNLKR